MDHFQWTTARILRGALFGRPLAWFFGVEEQFDILDAKSKRKSANQRYYLKRRLKQLDTSGYIVLGGEEVEITNEGRHFLEKLEQKELTIKKTKWTGTWNIVSYDIPEYKKKQREAFRDGIKRLGFYRVQKSLWVIPYECKTEIATLAQFYEVAPHVMYMTAQELPTANRLKKIFNLS